MSKRGAEAQMGRVPFSGDGQPVMEDAPRQATAAQLAARRIKQLPKRRGNSPALGRAQSPSQPVNGVQPAMGSMAPQQPSQQQPAFSFGGVSQQGGDGGFTFGSNAPTEQNPITNGFSNPASASFPPTNSSNNASQFNFSGGFNNPFASANSQIENQSPAPSPQPFAGFNFGSPQPQPSPSLTSQQTPSASAPSSFNFGATSSSKPNHSTDASTNPFNFGGTPSSASNKPHETSANPFNFGGTSKFSSNNSTEASANPFAFGSGNSSAPASTNMFNQPAQSSSSIFGQSSLNSGQQTPLSNIFGQSSPKPDQPASPQPGSAFSFATPGAGERNGQGTPKSSNPFAGLFDKPASSASQIDSGNALVQPPATPNASNVAAPSTTPFIGSPAKSFADLASDSNSKDDTGAQPAAVSFDFAKSTAPPAQPLFLDAANSQTATPKSQPPPTAAATSNTQAKFNPFAALSNNAIKGSNQTASTITEVNTAASPATLFSSPAKPPTQPSTSLQTPNMNIFGTATAERTHSDSSPSLPNLDSVVSPAKPADSSSDTTNIFAQSRSLNNNFDMFKPSASQPSAQVSSMDAVKHHAESTTSSQKQVQRGAQPSSVSDTEDLYRRRLQAFNVGLMDQLKSQNSSSDWSPFLRFALQHYEKIQAEHKSAKAAASSAVTEHGSTKRRPDEEEHSSKAGQTPVKAPRGSAPPASTFAPAQSNSSNGNVATAGQSPSPRKPNDQNSATSNLFASILDKAPSSAPSPNKSTAGTAFASFGAPSSSSSSSNDSPANIFAQAKGAPAAASGMPAFSGSSNFMAQFGQNAKDEERKAMEKRKLEDMDSDEDEAEWEKRDAEEQAAKKAKAAQTSNKKAVFVPGKGMVWEDADQTAVAPTPLQNARSGTSSPGGRSIFDALDSGRGASIASGNIFGHLSGNASPAEQNDDEDESDAGEGIGPNEVEEPTEKELTATATPKVNGSHGPGIEEIQSSTPSGSILGRSLFDRIQTDANGSPIKDSPLKETEQAAKTNAAAMDLFGFAKNKPPVLGHDNTWKVGEPIKFNAAPDGVPTFNFNPATPTKPTNDENQNPLASNTPFSGAFSPLFGSTTPRSSPAPGTFNFGGQVPPSKGASPFLGATSNGTSVFGTPSVSRGTTPGASSVATDDDAHDDADTLNDPQQSMTGLTAEEQAKEEVLFEVEKAKALHFVQGDPSAEEESKKKGRWDTYGVGPFRILKSKTDTTQKRILMRAPNGQVLINSRVPLAQAPSRAQPKTVGMIISTGKGKEIKNLMMRFANVADVDRLMGLLEA